MEIILIACVINVLNIVNCYSDSESVESNRIEVSPFYDTIIYSDIADIFNDFETNGISPFDLFANSESQSAEQIEDLLTEYQHRLEKAHKQRKKYIEKSKNKNKVPLLPHEQFSKTKPGELKNNDLYFSNSFYNPGVFKLPHPAFSPPLDLFIPLNSKAKYVQKPEMTTDVPKGSRGDLLPMEKIIFNDKKILTLPPVMHKLTFDPIKSACFCKNGIIPCKCNCKQCLVNFDPFSLEPQIKMLSQEKKTDLHSALLNNSLKKYDQVIDEKDLNENTLNIHIKVDLQLPKVEENIGSNYNHIQARPFESEGGFSKEFTTAIKLPFPYFSMPGPIDIFNHNKPTKFNKEEPIHKFMMHKKKKSRTNNNNKKHRKKIITIHNIKLEQQPLFPLHLDDKNSDKMEKSNGTIIQPSKIIQPKANLKINTSNDILNDTYTEDSAPKNVSTTTEASLHLDDKNSYKYENSVETDFTKNSSNSTTELPTIRKRRDISNVNRSINGSNDDILLVKSLEKKTIMIQEKNNEKKFDKNVLNDAELLYWPAASKQETFHNRNITSIILENEHKKTKLNISKEIIRQNHTKALEQAIFGDVNWDDIDTVAPTFMSFIGKYVQGMLTFCSDQICHSMNCANKTCLHRICIPQERLNNKGHCAGSNNTDSVASMESIMDLPSNIVFEVVDIIQSKMLGKVFGKATFCISSKCITLAASKKTFIKSRCIIKELTVGHCSSTKTVKIIPHKTWIVHVHYHNMSYEVCSGQTSTMILPFIILVNNLIRSTDVAPLRQDVVYNPWTRLNRNTLKIINITANGIVQRKKLENSIILDITSTLQAKNRRPIESGRHELQAGDWDKDIFEILKSIVKTLTNTSSTDSAVTSKPQKAMKILTTCNKDRSVCRFLSCPNIQVECILCEITFMNIEGDKSTQCESFPTSFLI